jgi:signal transduction histidine kinase
MNDSTDRHSPYRVETSPEGIDTDGLSRRFGVAARLTLGASFVLAIALFVGGALFSSALSSTNRGQLAEAGRERVNALVSIIEQGAVPVTLPSPRDSLLFAQVIGVDGHIAGSTQNVRDMELIAPPSAWKFADTTISTSKATVDNAGCELFVRKVPIQQAAPGRPLGNYYVLVATPIRQSDEMQVALQRQLIAATPAVLAGAALLFYVLARRALRPVDLLRREVDALSADDLSKRVSAPPTSDEVGRLGRTMNGLLDRIQRFSERQGRFVSDASHELRTPLAASRTRLEVGLLRANETDWPSTARSLLQENERMTRLVEDLLLLARTGESAREPFRTVDLDEIVLEAAATARLGSAVKISVSEVSAGRVLGNPDQLRRVVTNLLDNALRYAETEVRITLSTVSGSSDSGNPWSAGHFKNTVHIENTVHTRNTGHTRDTGHTGNTGNPEITSNGAKLDTPSPRGNDNSEYTILRVIDDGPGIAEANRLRIFERFSRLDDDRSRGSGGSGLGLSIVAELVRAHSGFVMADGIEPHGTIITVRLPASS